MTHAPWKNPLDFGGNSDHVTLGLGLGLGRRMRVTVDVPRHCLTPSKTVLRLGEDRVIPGITGYV